MKICLKPLRLLLLVIVFASQIPKGFTNEPITVVASFSILGDIVEQIGGDAVSVSVLVGLDSDAHVYRAKPSDAKKVQQAQVLVINGLGFEGWMSRLEQSSGFNGVKVVATDNIPLITDHEPGDEDQHDHAHDDTGNYDPHAWHSISNVIVYTKNIAQGLITAAPDQQAYFESRADQYIASLQVLDQKLKKLVSTIPEAQRVIITSHDAFGYLGRAYGFTFYSPQGISTESEPSAKDVAILIRQIRNQKVKAVFIENVTDARLMRQIAAETDVVVGGTLFSGALSTSDGPAASYIDMMIHNVTTIVSALK